MIGQKNVAEVMVWDITYVARSPTKPCVFHLDFLELSCHVVRQPKQPRGEVYKETNQDPKLTASTELPVDS